MMVETLPTYDPTLFQGAAWYYARYRAKYPQPLFDAVNAASGGCLRKNVDLLAETFKLSGKERLLDLGCGVGTIAIPFRNRFAEVVAVATCSSTGRQFLASSRSRTGKAR